MTASQTAEQRRTAKVARQKTLLEIEPPTTERCGKCLQPVHHRRRITREDRHGAQLLTIIDLYDCFRCNRTKQKVRRAGSK